MDTLSMSAYEDACPPPLKNYRGIISNSSADYLILNEILSGEDTRTFSAVKVKVKNDRSGIENDATGSEPYCAWFVSKDYINQSIFSDLQIDEERKSKFYSNIKSSFGRYKEIQIPLIQQLIDYVENDDGLFFILEYCEYTLKDFLEVTREPYKNSKYPFEVKIRKMIYNILQAVSYIHQRGQYFCAMLNSSDILVKETSEFSTKNSYIVKLPHPFLTHLATLLKFKNKNNFPSFFPPEVYQALGDLDKPGPKDKFEIMTIILSTIDQNFDIWALGYLIYEMIFGRQPFSFDSNSSAVEALKPKYEYDMWVKEASFLCVQLICKCLQYYPKDRLQNFALEAIIEEMEKDEERSCEDLERELKLRLKEKSEPMKFNLGESYQLELAK